MTPNVFFLQLALFTMANSAADFVFPDQIEIVSESPTLNVRQAPFISSYENHQWDDDDGHQYRTQFTLRRAKPFGESKPRKPLSTSGDKQQGSGPSQSANMLTPSNSNRRPAGYPTTTSSHSSAPPAQSSTQTSYDSNENFSQSHFRNDNDVIHSVQTANSTSHNIAYYSPSKTDASSSSSAEGGQFPFPITHMIRPMATQTNSVSDSQNPASSFPRPVTVSNSCTGANCRRENRPSGTYVSSSFDQTHSTSVITAVGPKPAQSYSSNEQPKRPQISSSASSGVGSGLYFGSSETYAFRSSFEANGPGEDVSGDDIFLSLQDLVKYPLLSKLYNSDSYNTQYKTLFRASSSSSSQSTSSGASRSASSFPRDFPVFPSFSQSSGPYLRSSEQSYFFER